MYNFKLISEQMEEIAQWMKELRELEDRKKLFTEWAEKLELDENATIGEFMEKLKLYQNLNPEA